MALLSSENTSQVEGPAAGSQNDRVASNRPESAPKGDDEDSNTRENEDSQELQSRHIAPDTVAATPDENDAPAMLQTVASAAAAVDEGDMIEDFDVDPNSTDTSNTDTDSAITDMRQLSSTASLNPSLYDHVVSHGRTYHKYKDGKYMLPNDENEQNRLDLQHHLFLLTLHGQLYLAPIKPDLHNVLDIGTGTGIWAIDFAMKYPSANVIGCDLSPIQPVYVPANCRFEVDDVEDEWLYNHKFDYIHGRLLASCFTDGAAVFKKAFAALEPGGFLEMQEVLPLACIDSSGANTQLFRWVDLMIDAATRLGRDWAKGQHYRAWMESAGFVDIKEVRLVWPMNTWPRSRHHKMLGVWANQDLKDGVEGFSMVALTKGLGWSEEDVRALLVDVRRDLDDRGIHAYMPILVVYGRKPG